MACGSSAQHCREKHIATRLRDTDQDGEDFETRCPLCGHGGFRISKPRNKALRHVWTCNCKKCGCGDPVALRNALLGLGVSPGCLGTYAASARASTDPNMAARLDAVTADILAAPHLKPSDMRILIAEARGQKPPAEFRAFVRWAVEIGVGRTQAYEAAGRWCRPADGSSSPEGGVVDT